MDIKKKKFSFNALVASVTLASVLNMSAMP